MTICIGKSIIKTLAQEGAWRSEDGEAVIAGDELFHHDPYAEIERLRGEIERLQAARLDEEAELRAERRAAVAIERERCARIIETWMAEDCLRGEIERLQAARLDEETELRAERRAAVAIERERCARLAEKLLSGNGHGDYPDDPELGAEIAAAIRKGE